MTATQVSASLTRKGLLSIHGGEGVPRYPFTRGYSVHASPYYTRRSVSLYLTRFYNVCTAAGNETGNDEYGCRTYTGERTW